MNSEKQEISDLQYVPIEELHSLRIQLEEKNNLLLQKDQEIETLKEVIQDLQASAEENLVMLLTKDDQIHQKNHEIEALHARMGSDTVGFAHLQALEAMFNETNQTVVNSISEANLSFASIKQRIDEQVQAKFVEKYIAEIEAMKTYCANSVEQCKGKVTGLNNQITGILNVMTDEFGVYNDQQKIAAVTPARAKKQEQEALQRNFLDLQNELQGLVSLTLNFD